MALMTKAEWLRLTPWEQGYVVYMQEAHHGSELSGTTNPYPVSTPDHEQYKMGEMKAMLDVQDGEE